LNPACSPPILIAERLRKILYLNYPACREREKSVFISLVMVIILLVIMSKQLFITSSPGWAANVNIIRI